MSIESNGYRNKFRERYLNTIHREGAVELLNWLDAETSFFTDPASTKYHANIEGGLCLHSMNVHDALRVMVRDKSDFCRLTGLVPDAESIAIVSLLHDLCKANTYKVSTRNVKDENGVWQRVPFYQFEDPFPFGHGEKSVYLINKFMKLTDEEAMAIRFHMGFSNADNYSDKGNVGKAFEMYPLAFALHVADEEASYYLDPKPA